MAEPPKNGVQMVVFLTEVDFSPIFHKERFILMGNYESPTRNRTLNLKPNLQKLLFLHLIDTWTKFWERFSNVNYKQDSQEKMQ